MLYWEKRGAYPRRTSSYAPNFETPTLHVTDPTIQGSASTFLAICILATLIRFYIRIVHQRSFGWDDSLLLLGLVCLITGMALLYIVMDHMYDAEALVYGDASTFSWASADLGLMLERMLKYRQYSAAALSLMWFTICCVKFSFLALFKKLVRQKVTLERYWWFVVAFNVVTAAYGTTVYFLSCPYFTEDKVFELCKSTAALAIFPLC